MTQDMIVNMFFEYLVLLAPLVVVYIFVAVVFSWIKKLADVMSGRGW